MPKSPALEPKRLSNGKWLLDVSAKASPSGKRQRLFFPSQKKASLEADRLKRERNKWGEVSTRIAASDAEDAAKALEILKGRCSLSQAAQHWSDWKERCEASVTFSELWRLYMERKEGEASAGYLKDMQRYSASMLEALGGKIVSEIQPIEIEEALDKNFKTPRQFDNARRTIRPAFSFALKRGYVSENPFTRIEHRKIKKGEVCIATLKECRAVITACTDLSERKKLPKSYLLDCTACLPAVVIQLFAGVRPMEIQRLQWEHIDFDHGFIKIDHDVAKTRSVRIIRIEPNLRAWLDTLPEKERSGSVVPGGYAAKIKAIRYVAGISQKQDVLRHSFASYHLAAYADLKALQEAMGHGTPEMVLKHYRALVTKADAVEFWKIAPKGVQLIKEVA